MATNEEKAEAVGESKSLLLKQLNSAKNCLTKEYRDLMKGATLDFENKRLVSVCGFYALEWRLRDKPDEPISYENQQTNVGTVRFIELRKKRQFRSWSYADEAELWWQQQGNEVPPRDEWSDSIDINSPWQQMYKQWYAMKFPWCVNTPSFHVMGDL